MKRHTVIAWLAAALTLIMIATTPAKASLTFKFSFSNVTGNVAGTVSGRIFGLNNNATGSASSILIDSFPAGLLGGPFLNGNDPVLWGNVPLNSFTVTAGGITFANFAAQHASGIESDVFCLRTPPTCATGFVGGNLLSLNFDGDVATPSAVANNDGLAGATFSALPEPPTALLLVVALAGIGAARRRRLATTA